MLRRMSARACCGRVALVLAGVSFPATVLLAPCGVAALLAATLVFRIAYSGTDVPHDALLTRLGDTPARAVGLARARAVGTALASLLAAGVASGGGGLGTAPLLWAIAAGGALIGATMVPLPFLAADVIGIVALGALAKAVLRLPGLTHARARGLPGG